MENTEIILTRVRVTYGKTGNMRYVGNLDLHTVWERTLRRAGLPLAFTKGFKPRPRFHLASSLPMGASSQCELMDVWMENAPAVEEVRARLEHSAPPGLQVFDVQGVDLRLPALQTQICAAVYVVRLKEMPQGYRLAEEVKRLLAAESLVRVWRMKEYDLRALIEGIEVLEGTDLPALRMQLAAREGATGRPEEVLAALGLDANLALLERTALIVAEQVE